MPWLKDLSLMSPLSVIMAISKVPSSLRMLPAESVTVPPLWVSVLPEGEALLPDWVSVLPPLGLVLVQAARPTIIARESSSARSFLDFFNVIYLPFLSHK